MKQLFIALLALVATQACTSARVSKNLSAGAIGCPANEITITNETAYVSTHNWTAECDGKRYICSYVSGGTTNCKERAR